jgi:hypothetical protein
MTNTQRIDSATERRHFASTALMATGAVPQTFRSWRANNGLFAGVRQCGAWQTFSIVDMCVLRAVVVLVERAVAAQRAVDIATRLAPHFERLNAEKSFSELSPVMALVEFDPADTAADIGIHLYGWGTPLGHIALRDRSAGLQLLLNLGDIRSHVLAQLREIATPALAPKGSAGRLLAEVFARGLERGDRERLQ